MTRRLQHSLIRLDELWVQDRERQDYTTIRLVRPDILIEGKDRRRNLCGLTDTLGKNADMKGFHPFTKVCPNDVEGYFWGLSEIANIYRLQDDLNDQLRSIRRLTSLKANAPKTFTGFSGLTPEKVKAFRRPGGYISEENPNAKMTDDSPDIPQELFVRLDKTIAMFDDVAGFTGMLKGEGEQGVRSAMQAQAMSRNASPRMRDRALLVERQCTEWGEFNYRMLQAKDAEVLAASTGDPKLKTQFLLSPDAGRRQGDGRLPHFIAGLSGRQ